MSPTLELELPFPPSVNHLWRTRVWGKRSITYMSAEGKKYRRDVALLVTKDSRHKTPIEGRLAMVIVTHRCDKRVFDLDNTLKSTLDSLQSAGVYKDDSQIDSLHITRGNIDPEKKGYLNVAITRMVG